MVNHAGKKEVANALKAVFVQASGKKAKEEALHKGFIEAQQKAVCTDGYWLGIEHVKLEP